MSELKINWDYYNWIVTIDYNFPGRLDDEINVHRVFSIDPDMFDIFIKPIEEARKFIEPVNDDAKYYVYYLPVYNIIKTVYEFFKNESSLLPSENRIENIAMVYNNIFRDPQISPVYKYLIFNKINDLGIIAKTYPIIKDCQFFKEI